MRFRRIKDAASSTTLAVSLKHFDVREAQGVWIFGKSQVGVQPANPMATAHPKVAEANGFFQVQES